MPFLQELIPCFWLEIKEREALWSEEFHCAAGLAKSLIKGSKINKVADDLKLWMIWLSYSVIIKLISCYFLSLRSKNPLRFIVSKMEISEKFETEMDVTGSSWFDE